MISATSSVHSQRPAACDAETLADLRDLFGPARLMQMLSGFRREIDTRLHPVSADRDQLGRDAHSLVSVAGALGFMPFSHACVALERACLDGSDIESATAAVLQGAEDARGAIAAIQASASSSGKSVV